MLDQEGANWSNWSKVNPDFCHFVDDFVDSSRISESDLDFKNRFFNFGPQDGGKSAGSIT